MDKNSPLHWILSLYEYTCCLFERSDTLRAGNASYFSSGSEDTMILQCGGRWTGSHIKERPLCEVSSWSRESKMTTSGHSAIPCFKSRFNWSFRRSTVWKRETIVKNPLYELSLHESITERSFIYIISMVPDIHMSHAFRKLGLMHVLKCRPLVACAVRLG